MSGKKTSILSGPYRATKLWNDAVRAFYNGMPVSRHWRGLRQYDRCFAASEAIDWLHTHLQSNPNFGNSVSREQTTKLLRKFVKAGLIEDVQGHSARPESFKDNKDLYRFCNKSPLKALRTPRTPGRTVLGALVSNINGNQLDENDGASPNLKKRYGASPTLKKRWESSPCSPKQPKKVDENVINEAKDSGMQECHVVAKPLTKEETNEVWKHVFLERLDVVCKRLLFTDSSTLLDSDVVVGEFLRHNMTQITARGVVQAPEGHPDNLPNWILTAMKCMAHWPNTADSSCNIPNYPGVERDVFKIVRDFFTNLIVPLVPYELYDAIIRLYIGAEFMDITCRSASSEGKESIRSRIHEGSYIHNNLEGGDSVENLILDMSISSTQKTSTPYLETEEFAHDENDPFQVKRRSLRRDKSKRMQSDELQTPVLPHREVQNLTIPQSLKLQKLKNYTDFKEDNLYPSLLEGSCEAGDLSDTRSKMYEPPKVIYESVLTKQAETVRSVKTNDLARRMKKENREAAIDNSNFLQSSEISNVTLPHNCCFETAFTSDSPKTRIIPQKSIDTLHLSLGDRNPGNLRPRPVSIAVTSLAGLESHHSDVQNLWDTTRGENLTEALDMMNKSNTLSTSGRYVTAPIASPLSRSRSAGNLHSLNDGNLLQITPPSPRPQSNPYKTFASRLLDSVRRKNSYNTSSASGRSDGNVSVSKARHLRTKSGGYMNPGLVSAADTAGETTSIYSHASTAETNSGPHHLRTKSGGFLNLALMPSHQSLDQMESFDTVSTAPIAPSDLSIQDGQPFCSSRCSNYSTSGPPSHARHRMTTPDGCLSHTLSSTSSVSSSGRSMYYSACSHASRSNTPVLPCRPSSEGVRYFARDNDSLCSSYRVQANDAPPASVADPELKKRLSLSANELSDGWVDRTPYGQVPPYAQGGVWRHYHSSPRLLTKEGKEFAVSSIQLLLLMLSPVWRRKLHLLLRMMKKMSHNEKLDISDKQTTRALVLNTFTRSILLCSQEADYDEVLSLRIVSFMMDNHEEIMRPPQDIAVLVHRKLSQLQRSQIVYDSTVWDRSMTLTYCQQVSQVQYQRQRMTGSQQFLAQLLDQILTNDKLTNKEKRKKLKEFKSLYPEVYKERFPQEMPEKSESRGFKLKSLMKFTSLTSLKRRQTLRL